jgi:hypothetical protein
LAKHAPGNEDWVAVGQAISDRMAQIGISTARLARETGLSETTIRYIGNPASGHNKSTLVAISAVLGWRYDHLTNILLRQPQENPRDASLVEAYFENLLHTEVGSVKDEVAEVMDIVQVIDKKIDVIISARHAAADSAGQPRPAHGKPPEPG